jgi:hypothetical protein
VFFKCLGRSIHIVSMKGRANCIFGRYGNCHDANDTNVYTAMIFNACLDCHDPNDMNIRTTIQTSLQFLDS